MSLLQWRREQPRIDYDSTSLLSISTTHIVSLLPNGIQHIRFLSPTSLPHLRIDKCMSLRKWSMSVRSLAAEYSLWQLRTGTWDWQLRTGRPTGYWQSRRVRGTGKADGCSGRLPSKIAMSRAKGWNGCT